MAFKSNILKQDELFIYCDGGARGNPGPAAIGVVIKDQKGNIICRISDQIGISTNNFAEYSAVIAALNWMVEKKDTIKPSKITIYLDSFLIVNQLNGKFKIKNRGLKNMVSVIKYLEAKLGYTSENGNDLFCDQESGKLNYVYIPREKNTPADSLVNRALDNI